MEDTLGAGGKRDIIRKRLKQLNACIIHTFREANSVVDLLANEVVDSQQVRKSITTLWIYQET